jgi:hypothetical protein
MRNGEFYVAVVAAQRDWLEERRGGRPPPMRFQTHIGGRGGEGALEVAGSERALTPVDDRGREKDGQSFWQCAIGDFT